MMRPGPIDPAEGPKAVGGYAQAYAVTAGTGLLFVSGQPPVDSEGVTPFGFEAQCRQAWRNLLTVLRAAGLDVTALVKVTTYLSDRKYANQNGQVRREVLGAHRPALAPAGENHHRLTASAIRSPNRYSYSTVCKPRAWNHRHTLKQSRRRYS